MSGAERAAWTGTPPVPAGKADSREPADDAGAPARGAAPDEGPAEPGPSAGAAADAACGRAGQAVGEATAGGDGLPAAPASSARAPTAPVPAAVTPDRWAALRRHTPARIALGRVGASLPTTEVLRLAVAHAQARDAVRLPLDADALDAALRGEAGFAAVLRAESAAPDRDVYLRRPDLGRRLDERSRAALREAALPGGCDLLLVIGDGLSSLGIARHAAALAGAVRRAAPPGWTLGPPVIATQARVALGDDVAVALGARMVAVLIGERPGLSSPDSVGVYLTWAPRTGRTDAERNCISNVRPEGLPVADAARRLWWLCEAARRMQATGVRLKDESELRPADG